MNNHTGELVTETRNRQGKEAAPLIQGAPTGYALTDDYVAQETKQGGRLHYTVLLPIPQIPATFPIPDPLNPFEDNRGVRVGHAQAFADYVERNESWHAGVLTMRTQSDIVRFRPLEGGDLGTVRVGILSVPRNARNSFRIVDGQHRILGFKLLIDQLTARRSEARTRLTNARNTGEPQQVLDMLQRDVNEVEGALDRVQRDSIGVDLLIEDDPEQARQVFVDVANNALGITKTVQFRFDARKVVSRATNLILSDPSSSQLIENRVDLQLDRVTGNNPNLLGASHLAEIVRVLTVGINGRVSAAQEQTLDERSLANTANRFFDVIAEAFPDLKAIVDGTKTPATLRSTTLVVSTTMLRILAGVFYALSLDGMTDNDILDYMRRLGRHMKAPITAGTPSGDLLIGATTSGAFTNGASAPGARTQQVKELVEVFTEWATNPPSAF